MRSEQLENIIALLRSSDSNGPSTVDDWRVEEGASVVRFAELARAGGHALVSWRDV